jgi:hypothetical protein
MRDEREERATADMTVYEAGLQGPKWAVALARRLGVGATMVETSVPRGEPRPFRERMEGK